MYSSLLPSVVLSLPARGMRPAFVKSKASHNLTDGVHTNRIRSRNRLELKKFGMDVLYTCDIVHVYEIENTGFIAKPRTIVQI